MVVNTPLQAATRHLRAFCSPESATTGHQARGNPCRLTLLPSAPDISKPPASSAVPQCATWPLDDQRAGVACWTADGTAIQICGHGLLCSATLWMDHWGGAGDSGGTLVMNGAEVACQAEAGQIWLSFEALETQPCEVPQWCNSYFDTAPIAAATAGPDNGYLVLQWPTDSQLASLPVPPATLVQDTQRALIVTCAVGQDSALHDENIHYRYFAPQHGVAEDLATGSAMRVLAHYWQQRDLGAVLTAYQYSQAGGLLFSRIQAGKVWIGGWTSPMAMEADTVE